MEIFISVIKNKIKLRETDPEVLKKAQFIYEKIDAVVLELIKPFPIPQRLKHAIEEMIDAIQSPATFLPSK